MGTSMTRTVLITGCSSGIGHALALAFRQAGEQVIATARDPQSLSALAEAGCTTLALDVNAADSRAALVTALQQSGVSGIDMLVNNAGISAMGPLLELPADKLQGQFATNVIAPVLMIQSLFPLLEHSAKPLIVNIGSVSGILTTPFAGAYCASKAALHSLDDALRMELKPLGVRVITVQPGAIQSNFGDAATASINSWLRADSRYAPIRDGIMARAGASQVGATPTTAFAQAVVTGLSRANPGPVLRIGHGSHALPWLQRLLPRALLARVLSRRFGLDHLQKPA